MSDASTRVAVFAKAPIAGRVKTRLIPALGGEAAAKLHRALVEHTLTTVCATVHSAELWCDPDLNHPYFEELSGRFAVGLRSQRGADLGARMFHAFADMLTHSGRAMIVGCDCPAMTRGDIDEAFDALRHDDAVLGPATDGGYWLIGLRRPDPGLFENIAWGSETVLNATLSRLRRLGWHWRLLGEHADIDRPEDLRSLPDSLRAE